MTSRKIPFEKLNNTRDLGGMIATGGARIRDGRLIRSGHLYFGSAGDIDRLSRAVGLIVDFRTDQERAEKPNPPIAGAGECHLPVFATLTPGVTREKRADAAVATLMFDPDGARQYMIDTYLNFASSETAHREYGRFLRLLSESRDGAVLWHCTAGKDRAGFATVLIQKVLGVDDADIMEDYLYTNECLAGEIAALTDMLERRIGRDDPAARAALGYLFGAREEYLMAALNRVEALYGSFDTYLREALGADAALLDRLKALYLEG